MRLDTPFNILNPDIPSREGGKPFLKWPGGKRWLADDLSALIVDRCINRYYEPFLGGGAVFFSLKPRIATLSDVNYDLINTYIQVQGFYHEIEGLLRKLPIDKEEYYRIRNENPTTLIEKAVRFIYLNRTAFGGIYRLNSKGIFNVPFGDGKRSLELLWRDNLLKSAAQALQGIELMVSDFENIMDTAGQGDVIYCDPTYTVTRNNGSFIRYNERNFSWADQKRLLITAKKAFSRGVLVIISNAWNNEITELYKPIVPIRVERKSLVSRKKEARRVVYESIFILDPLD